MTPEQFMQRFDFYADLDRQGEREFFPSGCRALLSEIEGWGITTKEESVIRLLTQTLLDLRESNYKSISTKEFRQKMNNLFAL